MKIGALLCVGALVNVGVAWVCVARAEWPPAGCGGCIAVGIARIPLDTALAHEQSRHYGVSPRTWIAAVELARGYNAEFADDIRGGSRSRIGFRSDHATVTFKPEPPRRASWAWEHVWVQSISAGWPCKALRCDLECPIGAVRPSEVRCRWGWNAAGGAGPSQALMAGRLFPLGPVPLGFLANTALYASLTGAVVNVGILARLRRRRHGHCGACGYDLSGLASGMCPECGCQRAHAATGRAAERP